MQINSRKAFGGVTLLELMLVLVIGTVVIIMGFRLYEQFKNQTEIEQIKSNVNVLLQALGEYYRAECAADRVLGQQIGVSTSFPVPMEKLVNYLPADWPIWNSLISKEDPIVHYRAQFNLYQQPRMVCMDADCTPAKQIQAGIIYIWKPEVGVEIGTTPAAQETYKNLLNADCIAKLNETYLNSCSEPTTDDEMGYLIWERLPSFNLNPASDFWSSQPLLNQFKQMYETFPLNSGNSQQKFLCGG